MKKYLVAAACAIALSLVVACGDDTFNQSGPTPVQRSNGYGEVSGNQSIHPIQFENGIEWEGVVDTNGHSDTFDVQLRYESKAAMDQAMKDATWEEVDGKFLLHVQTPVIIRQKHLGPKELAGDENRPAEVRVTW